MKEITETERFYYRLTKLRKELDLLLRDFAATMPKQKQRKPSMVLVDPRTGKPYGEKKGR